VIVQLGFGFCLGFPRFLGAVERFLVAPPESKAPAAANWLRRELGLFRVAARAAATVFGFELLGGLGETKMWGGGDCFFCP